MRKIMINLMLSVLMVGVFQMSANAQTSGYYTYTVSNGEATITGVDTSISGSITIPSTLGDCPVTSIGDNAFEGCYGLTNIIIPDSVVRIGNCAFVLCAGLAGIKIPDGVMSIGECAFEWCESLESIKIPDSVTSIGNWAFSDCDSLTSIRIPDGVTRIGDYLFAYCDNLESIRIHSSVNSIGSNAFCVCESLTDVYYGGSEIDWENIEVSTGNDPLLSATIHYNSSMDEETSVIKGDAKKDGKVNNLDSIRIAQYIAWGIELSDYEMRAADVNDDARVNNLDMIKLAQKLAGWGVEW